MLHAAVCDVILSFLKPITSDKKYLVLFAAFTETMKVHPFLIWHNTLAWSVLVIKGLVQQYSNWLKVQHKVATLPAGQPKQSAPTNSILWPSVNFINQLSVIDLPQPISEAVSDPNLTLLTSFWAWYQVLYWLQYIFKAHIIQKG